MGAFCGNLGALLADFRSASAELSEVGGTLRISPLRGGDSRKCGFWACDDMWILLESTARQAWDAAQRAQNKDVANSAIIVSCRPVPSALPVHAVAASKPVSASL